MTSQSRRTRRRPMLGRSGRPTRRRSRGRTIRCWGGWSWTLSCPASVLGQLLAALTAWEPLMGGELFPVEPLAGPECDVAGLLEAQWWRRAEQAESACWHDRVVLVEVYGRLGLAIADLRSRRVGQAPPDGR